jgi:hypothetical protein
MQHRDRGWADLGQTLLIAGMGHGWVRVSSRSSRTSGGAIHASGWRWWSGCSGPRTRSSMGSSLAYWSLAAAASPASPVQRASAHGPARYPGAQRRGPALLDGQQLGVSVPGGGCIPRLPSPLGEPCEGGQGTRALGPEELKPDLKPYRSPRLAPAVGGASTNSTPCSQNDLAMNCYPRLIIKPRHGTARDR